MTHFPSKVQAITIFLRTPSLLRLVNPLVVFISKWQSFKKCSRAAQNALKGRMRPAGRSLPTPGLGESGSPFRTSRECKLATDSPTTNKADCHWWVPKVASYDMLGEQRHYSNPVKQWLVTSELVLCYKEKRMRFQKKEKRSFPFLLSFVMPIERFE